ncbi:MAG: lipoyl synthase [Muribaculaceae bacterium]|nr:lipoyl synthase [Muribaculaceae bacterium]
MVNEQQNLKPLRKPEWLKIKLPRGLKAAQVVGCLNDRHLNTICSSGLCPNKGECWSNGTATFMIGGSICTRNCKFCNVTSGKPVPLDPKEITDIVRSIRELDLRHVVITSVDRDDLEDYGAAHWKLMTETLKKECPGVTMELLVPDFRGKTNLLAPIINLQPEVISHNLETVRRLTPIVRSVATYDTSLSVIRHIAKNGIRAKSGIMLGLGETRDEILQTMDDLLEAGCEVMTIGQYLQPSRNHYPVKEYIHPDIFEEYGLIGREKGFRHIESSPLVRSSYHAEKHIK